MARKIGIILLVFLIIVLVTVGGLYLNKTINKNSKHNHSIVSFGGADKHDELSLSELESNFDSPNDFIIISHYGYDMDFNSQYKEGDSLTTYYTYQLSGNPEPLLAIVLTYNNVAKTVCAPCGESHKNSFEKIFSKAFNENVDKIIEILDSLGLRK
jgi:hypothetical protein